jgi:hypothetical protein
MCNHKMEHHRLQVYTASPIVSKAAIVETRRQSARIVVTQSLDVGITNHECSHNNMYHSKCNACLIFSCFKVVM